MAKTRTKKSRTPRTNSKDIVSDWPWFADRIFPEWGKEVGPLAQKHFLSTQGITPKEAVVWAGGQLGLGASDMSQDAGGTFGK